jgi:hypothetical protein
MMKRHWRHAKKTFALKHNSVFQFFRIYIEPKFEWGVNSGHHSHSYPFRRKTPFRVCSSATPAPCTWRPERRPTDEIATRKNGHRNNPYGSETRLVRDSKKTIVDTPEEPIESMSTKENQSLLQSRCADQSTIDVRKSGNRDEIILK